ncbi:unnamed protein product [Allacma fusca]|uniref:Uncharacterized protein n=1 Tax=Allacma fusca TaxID=39272 RepID=A0A8J2JIK4_9HEXA|nr:unnamed protein product [Allacma fusca]
MSLERTGARNTFLHVLAILEVTNIKQEPPDQLIYETNAPQVLIFKYDATDQLDEPNVPEVLHYELMDESNEPSQLRITKYFSIVNEPAGESYQDIYVISRQQFGTNISVVETVKDPDPEALLSANTSKQKLKTMRLY